MTQIPPRQYEPDTAIPPGATVKEMLSSLCMTQEDLAERMGKRPSQINEIVSGKRPVSVETAIAFELVLGLPADFWINLEKNYRLSLARLKRAERMQQDIRWMRNTIPVLELIKRKVVPNIRDGEKRLQAVLSFFGVPSVEAWKAYWQSRVVKAAAFRRSTKQIKYVGRIAAWLRLGELKAQGRVCGNFNKQAFGAALHDIRQATTEDLGVFFPMLESLASCGVLVSVVKEIPGAGISGATRWTGKSKAHIQLTLLHKTDDQFWFTFFHEAGHILLHGKDEVFLEWTADSPDNVPAKEKEANCFATDFLIPPSEAGKLPSIQDKASAVEFANHLGISPGIVAGRLQHEGFITPATANYWKVKQRYDWESFERINP